MGTNIEKLEKNSIYSIHCLRLNVNSFLKFFWRVIIMFYEKAHGTQVTNERRMLIELQREGYDDRGGYGNAGKGQQYGGMSLPPF